MEKFLKDLEENAKIGHLPNIKDLKLLILTIREYDCLIDELEKKIHSLLDELIRVEEDHVIWMQDATDVLEIAQSKMVRTFARPSAPSGASLN